MRGSKLHTLSSAAWRLAAQQHWVLTRQQLLGLGYSRRAIEHRIEEGRLHLVYRGVYAVGRPELSREGRWMAALLSCGDDAVLSHTSAAALWGILAWRAGPVELSVPASVLRRRAGIIVHRRRALEERDVTSRRRVPVTAPGQTLLDLATILSARRLEAAINEADTLDLVSPEALRVELERFRGRPGAAALRQVLDRHTFTLTDSELERRFLPIARRAGLPLPLTGKRVNGFRVDFFWPELGIVVETDGLRYHRTPAQQARDRLRDQAHAAAGLEPLRFTRAQVRFEPNHVQAVMAAVAARRNAV